MRRAQPKAHFLVPWESRRRELWIRLWIGLLEPIPSNLLKRMAGTTRLELATSAVTGQRSNRLSYVPGWNL